MFIPKKIAVVRTDRLGDMVLTLPLVKALSDVYPDAEISVIARRYTEPLIEGQNIIKRLFFIDDYPDGGVARIFKQNNFDVVFFPRPVFKECLRAFLEKIPFRVGSAYRWYSFLFNRKIYNHRFSGEYHEAEFNVRMAEIFSGEKLDVKLLPPVISDHTINNTINKLSNYNLFGNEYIIIHPGSGGSAKDLPRSTLASVAGFLAGNYGGSVVLTGSDAEEACCRDIAKSGRIINLCGKLELRELIYLISRSKMLIANSTGVIHIAASLSVPTVGFYPNSPNIGFRRWGPYSPTAKIFTPPASDDKLLKDDMSRISANEIIHWFKENI